MQRKGRPDRCFAARQFQGFCRDLHSEAVDHLVNSIPMASLHTLLRARLTEGRKLDMGNPNPGNLGSDFGRLGMQFWQEVQSCDRRNGRRQKCLDMLMAWRNAIAHQDFDGQKLGGRTELRLSDVRTWRSACAVLARSFDFAVAEHLTALVGSAPW
jgi:hypothetical protein